MTKADLIRAAAKATHVTQDTAAAVLQAMIDAAGDALAAGNPVKLYGVGTFTVNHSPERTVYDFATGNKMRRPPRNYVTFAAAAALKRRVNSTEGGQIDGKWQEAGSGQLGGS